MITLNIRHRGVMTEIRIDAQVAREINAEFNRVPDWDQSREPRRASALYEARV